MPSADKSDQCGDRRAVDRATLRAASALVPLAAVSSLPRRRRPAIVGREADEFSIAVRSNSDRPVVVVSGEIDIFTAPMLHAIVRELLAQGHNHLTVDLGPVSFMDCSVLTFLVSARHQLTRSGGSLSVVGDNRLLRRLMGATGLTRTFTNLAEPRSPTIGA